MAARKRPNKKERILNKKRRKRIFFIAGAVVLAVLISFTMLRIFVYGRDVVVMYVGGYPVTREELQFHMSMEKTNVSNYFHQTHGVNLSGKSWHREYDGERPIEILRERGVQSVTDAKTLQIMALEYGVTSDISFVSMKEGMEEVNEQRKQQLEEGEILYGVVEFNALTYYHQVMGNFRTKVFEIVKGAEVFADERRIQDLYEENYYIYNNDENITIAELFVPYLPYGEQPTDTVTLSQDEAYELIVYIHEELLAGADFDAICEEYTGELPLESTLNYNSTNLGGTLQLILYHTEDLQPGEFSLPFQNGFGFSILKLLADMVEVSMPFEEAYTYLAEIALEESFDTFLEQKARAAEISIRPLRYAGVNMP